MKKLIIALLCVALLGGVGYLGYLIYKTQSIKSVELVGTPQTIYLTNDSFDKEDSYIKVTYNNGNVKEVPLDSSSVQISMFSTTDVKAGGYSHGTMNIVYKDNTFKVDYDVLQRGFYYLSSRQTITPGSTSTASPTHYTTAGAPEVIYFDEAGKLLYYVNDWSDGGYTLYDGNYAADYTYEIVGNEIKITAGKNTYSIKAKYDETLKQTEYYSEIYAYDQNGLAVSKTTNTYAYYTEGALIIDEDSGINLDFTKESRKEEGTSPTIPTLCIEASGNGYDSGDYKLFIHLRFMKNSNFLVNVYVKVYNNMFDDGGINIEGGDSIQVTMTSVNYICFGKALEPIDLHYKVI